METGLSYLRIDRIDHRIDDDRDIDDDDYFDSDLSMQWKKQSTDRINSTM